eukprot:6281-Chlamydomonas_euryale.AAC.8
MEWRQRRNEHRNGKGKSLAHMPRVHSHNRPLVAHRAPVRATPGRCGCAFSQRADLAGPEAYH